MSSLIHSALVLPGSMLKFYCKDGLSPLDVDHIEKIFNFGGSIVAVDCGVLNEWVAYNQSFIDMKKEYKKAVAGTQKKDDFYKATVANVKQYQKFINSDIMAKYKSANAHFNKVTFQAWLTHECGSGVTAEYLKGFHKLT